MFIFQPWGPEKRELRLLSVHGIPPNYLIQDLPSNENNTSDSLSK
uniref:Uncharacterized protein n=1 Tax=Anguilla anguilla TaxID=7936 RepID=A0A0E9QNU3_ANGAN